jgi:hypothetical protein
MGNEARIIFNSGFPGNRDEELSTHFLIVRDLLPLTFQDRSGWKSSSQKSLLFIHPSFQNSTDALSFIHQIGSIVH